MTKTRIQPFCRINNICLGYFDRNRVFPRMVTEKNKALYLHKSHFFLIWKTQGNSFKQTTEKIKRTCKKVDKCITKKTSSFILKTNSCQKY